MKIPDAILFKCEKYKKAKELPIKLALEKGEVVGKEVDADGRMIYVIRENGKIRMQYAQDTVIEPLPLGTVSASFKQ